jgi:DNA-binding NarL/FixJ family response regulator
LSTVANLYDELTHDQARRPAVDRQDAVSALLAEGRSGRLPADSVRSVLNFAGHSDAKTAALRPDGLTKREAEVLVEIARGLTTREIAGRFGISSKTMDKHTENLFRKIGVRSRTAAALYAMEKGLLRG